MTDARMPSLSALRNDGSSELDALARMPYLEQIEMPFKLAFCWLSTRRVCQHWSAYFAD